MPGGVTVRVEGLPELEAKLAGFEVKVRPALLATTRPGAKLLAEAIRSEAPVGKVARPQQHDTPGNLRDSVKFKASKTRRSGFTGHVVAPFGKGSSHRYLVIAGHVIKGRQRTVLGHGAGKLGRQATSRAGEMTRPNPFVQRGREKAERQALEATELAAKKVIDKAAAL